MDIKLTRRNFLKGVGAAVVLAGTGAPQLKLLKPGKAQENSVKPIFVRSTCSPNDTGACGYVARVDDGRISTLIQAADYPEEDYNPRGCLKGLSFINLIYGKDRLKYPLIRTGPRGSGEFRKTSWDEALDHTAGKLKEIANKYGPEAIGVTVQVAGTGFVQKGALVGLTKLASWTIHHGYDQNGDLPMFWPMTFGVQSEELESLEWLNSRYTMVFGSNMLQTRLPDVKQLIKSKNKGKLVVIDPDYCITASRADEWVSLKADTDAALALGISKIIIDKKLYDEQFLQDFTDMPVLVREDTGKRLLAKDVKELSGKARTMEIPAYRELFVFHNENKFVILNPESLQSTNAELKGEYTVELTDGSSVKVKTVFEKLIEQLKDYTPGRVSAITGVPEEQIRRIAVEAATNGPLHLVYGASNYQWYHGDLKGRAIALIGILTGNFGKSGAGISTLAGQYRIRSDVTKWWYPKEGKLNWVPYLHFLKGKGKTTPYGKFPESGIKAMISGWGNPFDQHNMANILRDRATSGELEFILTMDFSMTTSAQWSDVIFPVPTWYEKFDITATVLHPYLQLQQPAIKPLFETRAELWIVRELAKRLDLPVDHFYPELGENEAAVKATELLLETGGFETRNITLDMVKKGPVRLHSRAPNDRQIPFYEQIHDRVPFPPRSYPVPLEATAQFLKSGRIELYKDEELFIEEGEQLPVYKETFLETEYKQDPASREKYPLHYITKNSLYRVHSTHSNNPWLNELQGDMPKVYLNAEEAKLRSIEHGDMVEIYNNRGKVQGQAVIDPGSLKGSCYFYQGWWSRYLGGGSYNSLIEPWIKPLHEIYFVPGIWSPTTAWNECLVNVRKVNKS
ncbi:MAG: molybdopterin-dependent oxidoreductase [Candidatus Methanoperedens sp.]|nr:molybdopterin-dependent oxidoreductase [Candidatus Methanoperedens sp.]